MEILIKDGVRYKLWIPTKELKEFEPMVKEHAVDIFGKNSLYFDVKKRIETAIGKKTIPDAYLINFDTNEFYIIEIELSTHPEYDHINKQIGKFISALGEYKTRQKISRILKDYVEADIVREKFVRDKVEKKELYQFFLEEILEKVVDQVYHSIIVIDEKTKKIEDACNILSPKPKIIEFKTFARENAEKVQIHLFEPLHELSPAIRKPVVVADETIEVIGKTRKGTYRARFTPETKKIIMDGKEYSPSGAAKKLTGYSIDGWHFWKFQDPINKELSPIDTYRKGISKLRLQKVTAGEFKYKGNGIFVLRENSKVQIDGKKSTKIVINTLKKQGYYVTNAYSFYHQLRKKAALLRRRK